jgi:hypothetical protein
MKVSFVCDGAYIQFFSDSPPPPRHVRSSVTVYTFIILHPQQYLQDTRTNFWGGKGITCS